MENVTTKRGRKKAVVTMKPSSSFKVITEDEIRLKAYEIYLLNGGNSNELENWLEAEKELKTSF